MVSKYDRWKKWVARGAAAVACVLGVSGAGCSGDPDPAKSEMPPPRVAESVDPTVLENAESNRRVIEAAGYRLEGRAWFSPDSYAEVYAGLGGARMGIFAVRSNDELAARPELSPQQVESFGAYVDRVRMAVSAPASMEAALDEGDLLLFDPRSTEQSDAFVQTSQALVNEHCPLTAFNRFCGMQATWPGSATVRTWNRVDATTSSPQTGRGSAIHSVVCADRNDVTLRVQATNQHRHNIFVSGDIAVRQGTLFHWWEVGGWVEHEVCEAFFITCLDWEYRTDFDHADFSTSIMPGSGGNAHFCGNITSRASFQREDPCSRDRTCLPPIFPPESPDPCNNCVEHRCAGQRAACNANSTCLLMEDCAADCSTWDCVLRCGAWLPPSPPIGSTYNDLLVCVAQQCADYC